MLIIAEIVTIYDSLLWQNNAISISNNILSSANNMSRKETKKARCE